MLRLQLRIRLAHYVITPYAFFDDVVRKSILQLHFVSSHCPLMYVRDTNTHLSLNFRRQRTRPIAKSVN